MIHEEVTMTLEAADNGQMKAFEKCLETGIALSEKSDRHIKDQVSKHIKKIYTDKVNFLSSFPSNLMSELINRIISKHLNRKRIQSWRSL